MHFAITNFMGVLYPTCTTKTGRIWRWISEHLTVVRLQADPKREQELPRRQDWVTCIIVTIWLPDLCYESPLSGLKMN
jgi:hypothetical protein